MTRAALPLPSLQEPEASRTPADLDRWLESLHDLTWIRLRGRDASRRRIVSTLLHGNEPSGLRALHRWLLLGREPATETWILIGAVRAARSHPGLTRRFLPEDGDLNRVWRPPYETERQKRVEALLMHLAASGAEALLDLHNNTGHNPAYGVGPSEDPRALDLVALFGRYFVHSPLQMGTLVEATAPYFPSVTIECGRSGDPAADRIAFRGLERFLALERLDELTGLSALVCRLGDPVRVTLRPDAALRFEPEPCPHADLTLDPEIDRHNFQLLEPGTRLGWLRTDALPLCAHGADGRDRAPDLFQVSAGELRVARAWMPVMMTTDPTAATSDCLFYAVKPRG